MPGRPTIPFELHVARGTDRKYVHDRHENELKLTPGSLGDPPEWFKPEALLEWQRLTADPVLGKILSSAHRSGLIEYCVLHGRMIDDGRGGKGHKKMTSEQRKTLSSLRMQFGLTPAAQSKVRVPAAKPVEDEWDKLDRMRNA